MLRPLLDTVSRLFAAPLEIELVRRSNNSEKGNLKEGNTGFMRAFINSKSLLRNTSATLSQNERIAWVFERGDLYT